MKKGNKQDLKGRNLALTIILGIFIAIMIITLSNLIVTYFYEAPKYEDFCPSPELGIYSVPGACYDCVFSEKLQIDYNNCISDKGIPVYVYDEHGCASSLKECNLCRNTFDKATGNYNLYTFFIYATIGFLLIVVGLFIHILLIQIIALPAGAFLVIEAAVRNLNNKLSVIIVFALLIAAAVYLALKKLGNK